MAEEINNIVNYYEQYTCMICDNLLRENDKKAEYECGCHIVHSRCMMQRAYYFLQDHDNFTCDTCNMVLFSDPHEDDLGVEEDVLADNLNNLKTTEPFKTDLKKLKTKRSEFRKASAEFSKKVTEAHTDFNNSVKVSILSIKLQKRESLAKIKETQEYKSVVSKMRSFTILKNNFAAKYNLNSRELVMLKIKRWRWWRDRPTNKLISKFRIRI